MTLPAFHWENLIPDLLGTVVTFIPLLLALPIAWLIYRLLLRILRRSAKLKWAGFVEHLLKWSGRPLHWIVLLLTLSVAIAFTGLAPVWKDRLYHIVYPVLTGTIGWLAVSVVQAANDWLNTRFAWRNVKNNLTARRLATQLRVFKNVAIFFIVAITAIVVAMTIPSLHNLGLSLFASAGVAGLVVGMAARPALSNLIAGIQLALTQPIRLDDVVIVEGQWGRIEEINATYVVVLIWDERRLMVPLSYFIEKPFENWTHSSSELLGTVFLYVDYTVPVEALRGELTRLLTQSSRWDGRVNGIQVTDAKERTLEVRALMSAADASLLWDLRCEVREGLIGFLQREYPACLPRLRAEMMGERDPAISRPDAPPAGSRPPPPSP